MYRFRLLILVVGALLFLAVGVMGQTRRSARGGDAAATVAPSLKFGPSAAGAAGVTGAQGTSSSATVVPRLMKFSGTLRDAAGKPLTGAVDVTFSLYSTEAGGDALWFETQSIQADELGRYTALLGAMHADGLPTELFTSGEVRWLGIQVGHEPEQQPRVLLVSVPYALKAGDAETLGGKPASAYMLSDSQKSSTSSTSVVVAPTGTTQASATGGTSQKMQASGTAAPLTACASVTSDGTAVVNYIPMFTTACNVQNSILYQVNGRIGMGTTTPQAVFHMYGPASHDADAQYTMISTDTTSAAQGTGGGIAFAGFYNGTINKAGFANIRGVKENGVQGDYASALIMDTRVNGGNQTERMRITSAGNVGIGTSTPAAKLEVVGDMKISGLGNALVFPDNTVMTSAGPGTNGGTITGVTAGTDLIGGGTAGGVTLNLDITKVPQLVSANSFIGNQTVVGNISATGTFSGSGAGLTGIPNSALGGSARVRGIVYLAGCESCAPLTSSDSQPIFYINAVGAMAITSVYCLSDGGSPKINIARDNGGPTNLLTSDLTCDGTPAPSFTSTALAMGDELDFVMATPDGVAKRITVVIQTSLN